MKSSKKLSEPQPDSQPYFLEKTLIAKPKLPSVFVAVLLAVFALDAQTADAQQDAKAMDVLKRMTAYKSSLDQLVITGVTFTDARLEAGLMVSNSEEVRVSVKRPASMRISSFDGEATKGFYFHDGLFTFFNTANGLYAQSSIPNQLDAAMELVLEELDIEAPLMDFIYQDTAAHWLTSDETILYLADKARVGGVDCHHLAIRGPEVDVQLWIEEGDSPVPRKVVMTSKWEPGAPRFSAHLNWETEPQFEPGLFEFKAPDDATKINFLKTSSQQ